VWERRIRWCESVDQKFKEKEWEKVGILTSFKECEREAWGGVSGKGMLNINLEGEWKRKVKF
jgi:hypothetical protein